MCDYFCSDNINSTLLIGNKVQEDLTRLQEIQAGNEDAKKVSLLAAW